MQCQNIGSLSILPKARQLLSGKPFKHRQSGSKDYVHSNYVMMPHEGLWRVRDHRGLEMTCPNLVSSCSGSNSREAGAEDMKQAKPRWRWRSTVQNARSQLNPKCPSKSEWRKKMPNSQTHTYTWRHRRILFSLKKETNPVIHDLRDESEGH